MNTHGPKEPMPTSFPSTPVQNVAPGGQLGGGGTQGGSAGPSPGYGSGATAGGSFGAPKK